MSAIATHQLTKVYGRGRRRVVALAGVTLEVPAPSIFGLLGPNGAGKTTLVKILLALVQRSGGSALVLDTPATERRVRGRIGYLPEGQGYPEYLRGEDYVRIMGCLSGLARADARERARAWVGRVGLGGFARTRIRAYSKGMRQRLGLAAALVHDPELLLLDEPTDGVDPMGRKEIRDFIRSEHERGRTILLNSHLLSEVDQLCDRIAILNRGRLLASGPLEEVKASSLGGLEHPAGVVYLVESTGEDLGALAPRAPGLLRSVDPAGSRAWFSLPAPDRGATDLIDYFRAHGVGLRRVQPVETTLEDSFLALIQEDDRQPAGAS